jgi:hypothetical protein
MAVIGRIDYDASRMRSLVRHLLLALALLLAQQGALLHQVSHDAAAATQSDFDDGRHANSGPCIVCVAFAGIGASAAPSAVQPVLLDRLAFEHGAAQADSHRSLEAPAQRSRGPPAFL